MSNLVIHVQEEFNYINHSLRVLKRRTRALRLVSVITVNFLLYLDQTINMFDDMIMHCDTVIDSIINLMKGFLPEHFIHPQKHVEILNHAAKVLYQTRPNYVFAFTTIEQYYTINTMGYTVVNRNI